jgi:hypothetical protein
MNLAEEIKLRMDAIYRCFSIENGVRVNTHCLYPSNGIVQVVVMGSGTSYFVTDAGGAIKEAEAAGASIERPDRLFTKALKKQGLTIRNGAISSPAIGLDAVPAAIGIVANTSKELADSIFDGWRLSRTRNFKDMVRKLLKDQFIENEVREEKISGSSNKTHSFDNAIHFLNGEILLVDAVLKDANSINSRFVANMDVRSKDYPNIKQRIIYDDVEEWPSADLNLLGVIGVPILPFSKSERVISSLKG